MIPVKRDAKEPENGEAKIPGTPAPLTMGFFIH